MPVVCFTRDETSVPFSVTQGPANPDGNVNWLSNACKFYGWGTSSTGYLRNRFGLATMLFKYDWVAYADESAISPSVLGLNGNVVYQINDSGTIYQVQFPQADLFGLQLSQHGSVLIGNEVGSEYGLALGPTDTVRFGYRVAASSNTAINYSQLTITGFNI